jgi:hypothetical protein
LNISDPLVGGPDHSSSADYTDDDRKNQGKWRRVPSTRTSTDLVEETALRVLVHRPHANAAGHGVSGTHACYPSDSAAEMDHIADVEGTYLTVVEPDHQPATGIHADCLT